MESNKRILRCTYLELMMQYLFYTSQFLSQISTLLITYDYQEVVEICIWILILNKHHKKQMYELNINYSEYENIFKGTDNNHYSFVLPVKKTKKYMIHLL